MPFHRAAIDAARPHEAEGSKIRSPQSATP
jgi:hypothetical protein